MSEDKINYETAKFIFDAIQDSLNQGGLNWSRIGHYQELCKKKITDEIGSNAQ